MLTEEQIRQKAKELYRYDYQKNLNLTWETLQDERRESFVAGASYIAPLKQQEPEKDFLSVLAENYNAMKQIDESMEDLWPHKDILIETYEDMIAIYKNGSWRTAPQSEPVEQEKWSIGDKVIEDGGNEGEILDINRTEGYTRLFTACSSNAPYWADSSHFRKVEQEAKEESSEPLGIIAEQEQTISDLRASQLIMHNEWKRMESQLSEANKKIAELTEIKEGYFKFMIQYMNKCNEYAAKLSSLQSPVDVASKAIDYMKENVSFEYGEESDGYYFDKSWDETKTSYLNSLKNENI